MSKTTNGTFLWHHRWHAKPESSGGRRHTVENWEVCVFSMWPPLQTLLMWRKVMQWWLSTVSIGGVQLPCLLKPLDMSVKVVNKGFKGRDEKEEKLSSLGSIIPALYGGCPGGGVPPTAGARRGRRRCRHRRPRAGAKSLASHRLQRAGQLHSSSQMNRCLSLPAVSSEKQRRPLRGRGGESHTLWVMCNNSFDNCRGEKLPVFYPEKSNPRQPLALITDRKTGGKKAEWQCSIWAMLFREGVHCECYSRAVAHTKSASHWVGWKGPLIGNCSGRRAHLQRVLYRAFWRAQQLPEL